jgi:quinolinate synthase
MDIREKIAKLKADRQAVILAHNYQIGEVQDIADYTGDSLGLSQQAAATNAKVIVFCGVHFMAETAAILSPEKTVLIPDMHAGCPMADMITADQLRQLKAENPGAVVVCYVNSSAEVKAESDYCCTSSNAVEVAESIRADRKIIFVPDQHLGSYVRERTGRDMILWQGYCPSHTVILKEALAEVKQQYPDAVVLAHPECNEQAKELADELLSTGGMLKYARNSDAKEFIIATETGIIHTLEKENPGKKFYPASQKAHCYNMKKIDIGKILWSLEDMKYEVNVPGDIAERAKKSLERMLAAVPSA